MITSIEEGNDLILGFTLSLEILWSLRATSMEMVATDRKRRAIENKPDLQQKTSQDPSFCIMI